MASYTELIDQYISNELSPEDRKAFEEQLKTNPELKTQYELQLDIVKGAQRMGMKNQVQKSFSKAKVSKLMMKTAIISLTAIVVLTTAYFVKKKFDKPGNNIRYEKNEAGTDNWAEADRVLEAQTYKIDPTKDTVIETKGGIILAIPANAFLNKFGEAEKNKIEIEVKEALTPLDIMKAGLSTTSNGQLLETGGMFYVNARSGNDNLDIDKQKPLQASVPYSGKRTDMMLFDGKREKDGSINWVNPIPTEKQLVTTDILKLDFYPPHYLDSLKAWGYDDKNKRFTDSLYYSFIGFCNTPAWDSVEYNPVFEDTDRNYVTKGMATLNEKAKAKETPDGPALFKANCSTCHSMTGQHLTGPGLRGVVDRVPKGRWLHDYISNCEKMIKAGDPYANKILRENNGAAMTVFEGTLSPDEINSLINYMKAGGLKVPESHKGTECPEIDPSRIKAIWDSKFNNTFLATREFEERLKVIFSTCDDRILGLYTGNLDKSLWQIDSVAASFCGEPQKQQFLDFYKRRDGGVKINNLQMQKLQQYMAERKDTYVKAAQIAMKKMAEAEGKKDQVASEEWMKNLQKESMRNSKQFMEEYKVNIKEAYRQLDKPYIENPPAQNFVSGPVSTTGWKNVDRYVLASTANRSTLDYTDPESGKKVVIKYQTATVTVGNSASYDKIVCYLIPDKLSSFQLMKNNGTNFTENLNELIKYNLVVIGFKDDKLFYYNLENVKPKEYTLNLAEIREQDLRALVHSSSDLVAQQRDFTQDLKYQQFEQKELVRQKKKLAMAEFRAKLMSIVFPCYVPAIETENDIISLK